MEKHKQGKSAQLVVTSIALMLITLLRCVANGWQGAGINLSEEMKKDHYGAMCDEEMVASRLIVIMKNRKKPQEAASKNRRSAYSERQRAGPVRNVDWIFLDGNTVNIAKLRAISGQSLLGQLSDCTGATRQRRYAKWDIPHDRRRWRDSHAIAKHPGNCHAFKGIPFGDDQVLRSRLPNLWRVVQLHTKGTDIPEGKYQK